MIAARAGQAELSVDYALEHNRKVPGFSRDSKHTDLFCGKRDCIYLNGYWKLRKLPDTESYPDDDLGTREDFWSADHDDSAWVDQYVPWNWNYGHPAFEEGTVLEPIWKRAGQKRYTFTGIGWYRTHFRVPADAKGRPAVLHFEQADGDTRVWINGVPVAQHRSLAHTLKSQGKKAPSLIERLDADVTKHLLYGDDNTLVIRTTASLSRPLWVEFRPTVHARRIRVTPDIDTGSIQVRVSFVNAGEPRDLVLAAQVVPWTSYRYRSQQEDAPPTTVRLRAVNVPSGESEQAFTVKLVSPVLWNPETPFLYHLLLRDGRDLVGQARFGFRKIEVRGSHFYLNNKRLFLRGMQPGYSLSKWGARDRMNDNDSLRTLLQKVIKDTNQNFINPQNRLWGGPLVQLCDELGIVINDWSILPLRSGRHVGYYTPAVMSQIEEHVHELFNHPSVLIHTIGGESENLERLAVENFLYDHYKKIDPTRLICSKTGGWPRAEFRGKQRTDLYDIHDYNACHWHYADYLKDSLLYYHRGYADVAEGAAKPLINGETMQVLGGYISGWRWRLLEEEHTKIKESYPKIDRSYYVSFMNKLGSMGGPYPYILSDIGHFGIFGLAFEDKSLELHAEVHRKVIELFRQHRDVLSGFNFHYIRPIPFYQRRRAMTVTPEWLEETAGLLSATHMVDFGDPQPLFHAFKRACSPCAAFLSDPKRNAMAGRAIEGTVTVVNDSFRVQKDLTVSTTVTPKRGRTFGKQAVTIGTLDVGEHVRTNIVVTVPSQQPTCDYALTVRLRDGSGRELNANTYSGYILGVDQRRSTVKTGKRVGLYSVNEPRELTTMTLFGGWRCHREVPVPTDYDGHITTQRQATRSILDHLSVPYTVVTNFTNLSELDVLIVGFDSVDENLQSSSKAVIQWLENGGKLLSFEQLCPSKNPVPAPWCPELSFRPFSQNTKGEGAATFNFADIIVPDHPAFQGMGKRPLYDWNGFRGSVVEAVLSPLMEGVVAASKAGQSYKYGMAIAEVSRGKGLMLFSQLLATPRYGEDSVATRYLENVLAYVLSDDWDGRFAVDYRKAVDPVVAPSPDDIVPIDLRPAANYGLMGSPDGTPPEKQSWLDPRVGTETLRYCRRGAKAMPMGTTYTVHQIPFDLIDPATSDMKTCVVVSGKKEHKPHFPQSTKVRVHSGARRLFFLITAVCPHDYTAGTEIGRIEMEYSDNTYGATRGADIPLLYDKNISHWWNSASRWEMRADDISFGKGKTIASAFFIEWENPCRDSGIESVKLAAEKNVDLVLIGFTLEKIEAKLNK